MSNRWECDGSGEELKLIRQKSGPISWSDGIDPLLLSSFINVISFSSPYDNDGKNLILDVSNYPIASHTVSPKCAEVSFQCFTPDTRVIAPLDMWVEPFNDSELHRFIKSLFEIFKGFLIEIPRIFHC